MSEETPKVNEKTPRITTENLKNEPKAVKAGRRLAAISKASKEKKMRDKINSENKQKADDSYNINYRLVFGILGTAAALGSFYFTRKGYQMEDTQTKLEIMEEEPEIEPKHVDIKKSDNKSALDTLE